MNYHFSRMRDIAQEIEDTASFFARVYGNGLTHNGIFFGSGLVSIAQEVIDFIELEPHEWEAKVAAHAHAHAMSNKPGM